MTRYTLHVPLQGNTGIAIAPEDIEVIESRLLDLAGGFTSTDGVGAWRGDRTYHEPVRLYHVDHADPNIGIDLYHLAQGVRALLDQEAVYLTAQPIATTLVYAPALDPAQA